MGLTDVIELPSVLLPESAQFPDPAKNGRLQEMLPDLVEPSGGKAQGRGYRWVSRMLLSYRLFFSPNRLNSPTRQKMADYKKCCPIWLSHQEGRHKAEDIDGSHGCY